MKIVISPAKSLDYTSKLPTNQYTQPQFLEEAEKINQRLAEHSKDELKALMNISDKLADLNYDRYKDFSLPFDTTNARPAVYAYSGDVYTGLDSYTIPEEKIERLQNTLRILTGMYGVLRPLDLMQPYRLEMGNKLALDDKKDLYAFWREKITNYLNNELQDNELFVNLASNEYFKAVDTKTLKVPTISPVFKEYKNGQLKIISFYAKKARGSMARYIIDNNIDDYDGILGFDYDDYGYSEEYTEDKNEPVFIR